MTRWKRKVEDGKAKTLHKELLRKSKCYQGGNDISLETIRYPLLTFVLTNQHESHKTDEVYLNWAQILHLNTFFVWLLF